jgi:hypothetical protein
VRFHGALATVLAALAGAGGAVGAVGCARTHRGLCEEQVRARCELAYRCCTDANERFAVLPASLTGYATSEGECFDRLAPACRAQDGLDDAVALGRMQLDQELAAGCVDALHAARASCDVAAFDAALTARPGAPLDEAPACVRASSGVVDNGEACGSSLECAPGGFCDFGFNTAPFNDELAAFEGACLAPSGAGEECGAIGCAQGLVCLRDRCEVPPGDGEACPDFVCAAGNVCNAANVCEAFPGLGETCTFQCVDGAFCAPSDVEGEPGTCTPQRAPGDVCGGGVFDECANGETCLNGRCTGVVEAVCTGP